MQELLNKNVNLSDIIDIITEKLQKGGEVSFTPGGSSMKPMLSGEDKVILKKPKGRLKKYDLLFYCREKSGQYIIHRIVGFDKNGGYIACGDNQFCREYGITDNEIIGVVTGFYRKGKYHSVEELSYRIYCVLHTFFRPARRLCLGLKRRVLHIGR